MRVAARSSRSTRIVLVDLAAIITYERNAWGNNTGDMVTPKEVLELKQAEEK